MTSYEFEVAAKNAVVNELKNYGVETDISRLDFVWFAHELGYKKCTIWGDRQWEPHTQKLLITVAKMKCT